MNKLENKIRKLKEDFENKSLRFQSNKNVIELIPVKISQENIKLISKWRKENWRGFLTKFKVTEMGTGLWLENIWKDTDRILFLIVINKKKIGHIGIYKYNKKSKSVSIDSVLKGIKVSEKKIMEKVLDILFNWIFRELKLTKIQLEVFSDNFKAINLYERAGMLTICSVPLKKVELLDGWVWEKTKLKKNKIGERYLNQMEIKKNDFLELANRIKK